MPIGTDEVERFLARRGGGARNVAPVGAGEWSRAFRFDADGSPRVIRFGAHPEDFRKDEAASTGYGALAPIPRVFEIGEAAEHGHFAISEWAPGLALDRLPAADLRAALPALLDVLDRLRSAPAPTPSGAGIFSSRGRASHASWRDALLAIAEDREHPRLAGWRAELAKLADAARVFEQGAERLRELAGACPEDIRHLIHADLTAGNVLVHDGAISAVLDWGNALVGDFLYDVAWLVFWSPWHPGLDADFVIAEARRRGREAGADLHAFEERMTACQLQIGLDAIAYTAFRRRGRDLAERVARLRPLLGRRG